MSSRDFCFWLQGFFEIADAGLPRGLNGLPTSPVPNGGGLTLEQAAIIRRHLNMVFVHEVDPAAGDETAQAKLNHLHHGHTGGGTPRC